MSPRSAGLPGLRRALAGLGAAALALAARPAPAQPATPELLRAAIEHFVRERAPMPPDAIELPGLEGFVPPQATPGPLDIEVAAAPDAPLVGSVPLTVVVRQEGRELRRGVVTARLRVDTPVLVAARPLSRGRALAPADLRVETRDAAALGELRYLAAPEQALGLRAARGIAAGTALRAEMLEEAPAVLRGQLVRLRLVQGGLRIEGRGKARQDGRPGDVVRVQNVDSRRELVGRVAADGAVDVAL